jgi:hypothetical protein
MAAGSSPNTVRPGRGRAWNRPVPRLATRSSRHLLGAIKPVDQRATLARSSRELCTWRRSRGKTSDGDQDGKVSRPVENLTRWCRSKSGPPERGRGGARTLAPLLASDNGDRLFRLPAESSRSRNRHRPHDPIVETETTWSARSVTSTPRTSPCGFVTRCAGRSSSDRLLDREGMEDRERAARRGPEGGGRER